VADHDRRNVPVRVWLRARDYDALDAAARARGLSIPALIRSRLGVGLQDRR
jgi:hypothetical protein